MDEWKRDRLYRQIRHRLAGRPSGRVRREWGAVLHVARRLANPDFPDGRHNRPVLRVLVQPRTMDSTA